MKLPEFLLARIAEDEEFALRYPPTAAARPRALAECESKRRMVHQSLIATEEHKKAVRAAPVVATPGRALRQGVDQAWWTALQLLALPYADHKEYRAEWRP